MVELSSAEHLRTKVQPYYRRLDSRLVYTILGGRTRHMGWYEHGQSPWAFSAAMRRMEAVVARKLALPPGAKVLDAGCGVGDAARTVARLTGAEVVGIDYIESDIAIARRRTTRTPGQIGATRFLVGDFHDLPFDDDSFEGLYAMESFCHSAHPEKALSEFFRVLRPGGRLLINDYSFIESAVEPLVFALGRAVSEVLGTPSIFPRGDLEEYLTNAGFTVESVTDATPNVLPMLRAGAMLGRIPYVLARSMGCYNAVINAAVVVETYRHRDAVRYEIHVATKPAPDAARAAGQD
ncbi:methyltransferase domain-containing protein [Streptomyces sp. NPDC002994]|uniref:class I SAM-dependent methyltransferase n=1 Tax=Streptomyces sp. NPDC002994 TaxID=3154441 RepID=UPI0033A69429